MCGVELISNNAQSPTVTSSPLLGVSAETTQAGTSTTQSTTLISCNPIRGGSVVGVWISTSASTTNIRAHTTAELGTYKTVAYTNTPVLNNADAWNTSVQELYLKVYYRGYKVA